MSTQDLVLAISEAETKDDLTPFADTIGFKINAKAGLERTKADMIKMIEGTGAEQTEEEQVTAEESKEEAPPVKTAKEVRKIRNVKTGVVFAWTAALAKLPEMEEV